MSARLLRLAAIATAAGAFSGLFEVVRLRDGPARGRAVADRRARRGGLANAVSERALELSFAAVQLGFAWQLAGKAGLR